MEILKGLLLINGTDVYLEYGAFLTEDKPAEHTNYTALLRPANMKSYAAVSFREDNGEKLPETLLSRSEARDVTLQFAIIANSTTSFKTKYKGFIQFLKSGWLNINVTELGETFKMYFSACSDYEQLTSVSTTAVAAKFKVKLREPNPSI
jgi:hypothetical protein